MKGKWVWVLYTLYILSFLMFVCYLGGCSSPPTPEEALLNSVDWCHPESFTWYGTPEGITWENPKYVKYKDKENIEIVSKDGVVFGIYGKTLIQSKQK